MKIAIIGIGKMGGWLARELSKGNEVAVYDRDEGKAAAAKGATVLHNLPELRAFAPELAINAVGLQNTVQAFGEFTKYLPKACVLADVASVKAGLPEYYGKCGFRFASVHPMFGPTFADMEALQSQNAVIIQESDAATAEFFRGFFEGFGIKTYGYSFAEHDEMMAYSLTTPFVSSLVFASCLKATAVPGTTFAKHREIAKGLLSEDDSLLCEVLFNPYSLRQLERMTAKLEFFKHIIKARDSVEAERQFGKLRKNIG